MYFKVYFIWIRKKLISIKKSLQNKVVIRQRQEEHVVGQGKEEEGINVLGPLLWRNITRGLEGRRHGTKRDSALTWEPGDSLWLRWCHQGRKYLGNCQGGRLRKDLLYLPPFRYLSSPLILQTIKWEQERWKLGGKTCRNIRSRVNICFSLWAEGKSVSAA